MTSLQRLNIASPPQPPISTSPKGLSNKTASAIGIGHVGGQSPSNEQKPSARSSVVLDTRTAKPEKSGGSASAEEQSSSASGSMKVHYPLSTSHHDAAQRSGFMDTSATLSGTKGNQLNKLTLRNISRNRNTRYPIHSSARPIVHLNSAEQPHGEVCESGGAGDQLTAIERRTKKRLKHKIAKLKEAAELAAKSENGESDEKNHPATPCIIEMGDIKLGFQRPTFEERLKSRRPQTNIWQSICAKIRSEKAEMDSILLKIGLPPHNFRKDKSFPIKTYEEQPNLETCFAHEFADNFIFPTLLPAIQSMIIFARRNCVFQCVYCTFNPLDYITEYLYNNNPKHPERLKSPVPLFSIPFAKEWLRKFPRKPYPKWLTMEPDAAARIIQRAVRGWLVRKREDVQEMRQFWKDFKKDEEDEKRRAQLLLEKELQPIYSPYYEELNGEDFSGAKDTAVTASIEDENDEVIKVRPPTPFITHSDTCFVCHRFRQFLRDQEELRQLRLQEEALLQSEAETQAAASAVVATPVPSNTNNNNEALPAAGVVGGGQ